MATLHIYGIGGHGREALRPAREIAATPGQPFSDVGFVDDRPAAATLLGARVRRPEEMAPGDWFVLAIGSGTIRRRLHEACVARGLRPFSLVAPTARVGGDVALGPGALVSDFAMVTVSARVGTQFQCNMYSYVAHDCVIGDFVTFAPRVSCNGNVHVGNYAYIGTGAVIRQGTPERPLVIGEGATVGMGAVVTKDVPAGATVIGNPARVRQ